MKTIPALIAMGILGCQLQAQVSFKLSSAPGVGSDPTSVVAVDVNGDGKVDLICANYYGDSLSVLTNNGAGGFVLSGTYTVGDYPTAVAAADVNGDGKVDLISVNSAGNSMTVLTNNGSGGFVLAATYTNINGPTGVAAVDVNGDGKVDLITANWGPTGNGNTLTVFTNNGSGGFMPASSPVVGNGPYAVTAVNVNGDGKVGLISANWGDGTLSWLTNNGSGGFMLAGTYPVGNDPFYVAAADVNGDGKVDLISANWGYNAGNTLTVLTNSGSGGFGSNATINVGSAPVCVAAADVNGDGKLDLISANHGANTLTVLTNNGSGGFLLATNLSGFNTPNFVTAANVNGDSKLDLIIANGGNMTLSVLTNATVFPATELPTAVPVITGISPTTGNAGAVVTISGTNFSPVAANNTVYFGAVRAVVITANATNLVVTVPAGATYAPITETVNGLTAYAIDPFLPTFPSAGILTNSSLGPQITLQTGGAPGKMVIADLDGDGKPDLAVNSGGSHGIYIYRNISTNGILTNNSFAPPVILSLGTGVNNGMVAADLDRDGKLDLVCLDENSNVVVALQNLSTPGSISFGGRVNFAVRSDPRGVAVRDLDGDGKPEIVAANWGDSTISVLQNIGLTGSLTTNSFAPAVSFATGLNPEDLALADMDRDGKPDVVTVDDGSSGNPGLSVLRNVSTLGNIAFAAHVDYPGLPYSYSLAIGDMDGDGRLDVVIGSQPGGQSVSVYRNTSTLGGITLAPRIDFGLGGWGDNLALGDLDGDGKLDVAAVTYSSDKLSLFRNVSTPGSFTSSSLAGRLDFASGAGPFGVAIGDLDGDGRPDIVFCNNHGTTISIYQNIVPMGTVPVISVPIITRFSPASGMAGTNVTIYGTNFSPVAANNTVYFGAVQAVVNTANVTNLTVTVPKGATYSPITETVNGLTAYASAPFLPTFPSAGILTNSSLGPQITLQTGGGPGKMVIADLDGDGKPDLAVNSGGSHGIYIYRNISTNGILTNSSFAPPVILPLGTGGNDGMVAADLNGNGKLDLVCLDQNSNVVVVLQNVSMPGNVSFGGRVNFAVRSDPRGVAVRDLDGDGKPEIVVANWGDSTISVLRNIGNTDSITTNSFVAVVNFATGLNPQDVALADMDGDGKPDAVTSDDGSSGKPGLSVLRNVSTLGNIAFAAHVDYPGLPYSYSLTIGDLDGDGRLDVVIGSQPGGQSVSVYRNTSTPDSITFAPKIDFGLGGWGDGVALGDLDGDGKPDVAAATYSSDHLSLFRNISTPGSFTNSSLAGRLDFASGPGPFGVAIGDLDGDGRPDIVFCNNHGTTISIYQNIVPLGGVVNPPLHFVWNQIPSPQFANTPFVVVIKAQNPAEGIVTNFTGSVLLLSTNGVPVRPAVSGNFIQGVWTGAVTVAHTATNLVLQAVDHFGESGLANPINILKLPPLTTISSGNTLYIFWPVNSSGFVLETTTSFAMDNWVPVTTPPFQVGGLYFLPMPMTGTNAFFRLRFNGP